MQVRSADWSVGELLPPDPLGARAWANDSRSASQDGPVFRLVDERWAMPMMDQPKKRGALTKAALHTLNAMFGAVMLCLRFVCWLAATGAILQLVATALLWLFSQDTAKALQWATFGGGVLLGTAFLQFLSHYAQASLDRWVKADK